jgi:hypothetical protein
MAVIVVLGQAPIAALRGATELTVGGVKSALVPGLQHPEVKMTNRSAVDQTAVLLYLLMTIILLPLGFTAAAHLGFKEPFNFPNKLSQSGRG